MSTPTQHGRPAKEPNEAPEQGEAQRSPAATAETLAPPVTGEEQPRAKVIVGDPDALGAGSAQVTYQGYLGENVGPYEILGILGLGGFGAVFRARHKRLHRMAAVKFLSPDAAKNRAIVDRFFVEAQAANDIGHENIIQIYDVAEHATLGPYLVMELLEPGVSLAREIGKNAFSEERVIRVAKQICSALSAAHAKGIVHRDLKPDNIFLITALGQADIVKILDFGIAKLLAPETPAGMKTATGVVVGTPYYMSPEQCEGVGVDQRTDIYALGCILYQMLTQQLPFTGDTYGVIFKKHLLAPPPKVRAVKPGISERLEQVILQCLDKYKEQRFQSMEEVARALSGEPLIIRAAPDPGSELGQWGAPRLEQLSEPTPTAGALEPILTRSSSKLWMYASAALFTAIIVVALYFSPLGGTHGKTQQANAAKTAAKPPEKPPAKPTEKVEAPPVVSTTLPDAPAKASIVVVTDPAGVDIDLGGKLLGRSPLTLEEGLEITLKKKGYLPRTVVVEGPSPQEIVLESERDAKKKPVADKTKEPEKVEGSPEDVTRPKKGHSDLVVE